jgi:hypothetical protein
MGKKTALHTLARRILIRKDRLSSSHSCWARGLAILNTYKHKHAYELLQGTSVTHVFGRSRPRLVAKYQVCDPTKSEFIAKPEKGMTKLI